MRIMIKGGVWKNTEDEILKAAVMKYGKNQWARISSLLVRKSAKQCKARWYEWLDPSIKKTEWTREEDEKLLHLAKLMPTQWRTIAPIVGRTPAQCLERYEKLLDAASQRDEDYDASDDPRRLRPGEIDPNPESKPARPDAVDMDEDEKEMLSEARARLANTKGKKAKRKAREKQLEEARRLAMLQKKRELKAAGIETVKRAKRVRGLDYNAEIPFEKKPAPGFYDVSEERAAQPDPFDEETFKPSTIEQMEGPRKKDVEEVLMRQDIQRQRINERHDARSAVETINRMNDPSASRVRSKLMLPEPRVSDRELEAIAKMGSGGGVAFDGLGDIDGDTPGNALLSAAATPSFHTGAAMTPSHGAGATPARTPSVGGRDAILREAADLRRLTQGQTPLLGGEGPSLTGSDFSGITPARKDAPTPNAVLGGLAAATPGGAGAVPGATPLRDSLSINDPDAALVGQSIGRREEKARAKEALRDLRTGLSSLPAPTNEYEIVAPELPAEARSDDELDGTAPMEEDAADVLRREEAAREAERVNVLARRSSVVRRDLPRPPLGARGGCATAPLGSSPASPAALVAAEAAWLLERDEKEAANAKRGGVPLPELLPRVEPSEMEDAAALIASEVAFVRSAMGHSEAEAAEYLDAAMAVRGDWIVRAEDGAATPRSSAKPVERVAASTAEHSRIRAEMEKDAKRAAKLEHKVGVLTAGLVKRSGVLGVELVRLQREALAAGEEKAAYAGLHEQEQRTAPMRMETLMALAAGAREREAKLQATYAAARDELAKAERALEAGRGGA